MEKNNINFSFKTDRLFSFFFLLSLIITVSMLSVSKAGTRFPNRPSHLFERFRCNQNQHLNNNLSVIDATVGWFFSRNFHTLSIFHLFAWKKMCTLACVHCFDIKRSLRYHGEKIMKKCNIILVIWKIIGANGVWSSEMSYGW